MKVVGCMICLFHWSATFSMRWVVSSRDENGRLLLLVWGGRVCAANELRCLGIFIHNDAKVDYKVGWQM